MDDERTHTDASRRPTPALSEAVPTLWVVYHADPRRVGARRVLTAPIVVGRRGEALGPGLLDDSLLSRSHARLEVRGRCLRVTDLDSRNGTWVNGARVTGVDVDDGGVIALGSSIFTFRWTPSDHRPARGSALVGWSAEIAALANEIERVAPLDATVLIRGQPGVGKALVARELHRLSGRKGSYVPVNCAGVAPSVLYGGGLVEQASGGTLFLDEIGDAPLELQASLLRLLENREFRPVGSDRPRQSDIRFVAATNRDLQAAVASGAFRADLLTRLEGWPLQVPGLEERREDILVLAAFFAAAAGHPDVVLQRPLAEALLARPWPGNVRELRAVVERVAATAGPGPWAAPDWLLAPPLSAPAADRFAKARPDPDAPP